MAKYVGGNAKVKAAAYRHSEAGRMARKMYLMQPEVKAKMAIKRKVVRQMKGHS